MSGDGEVKFQYVRGPGIGFGVGVGRPAALASTTPAARASVATPDALRPSKQVMTVFSAVMKALRQRM